MMFRRVVLALVCAAMPSVVSASSGTESVPVDRFGRPWPSENIVVVSRGQPVLRLTVQPNPRMETESGNRGLSAFVRIDGAVARLAVGLDLDRRHRPDLSSVPERVNRSRSASSSLEEIPLTRSEANVLLDRGRIIVHLVGIDVPYRGIMEAYARATLAAAYDAAVREVGESEGAKILRCDIYGRDAFHDAVIGECGVAQTRDGRWVWTFQDVLVHAGAAGTFRPHRAELVESMALARAHQRGMWSERWSRLPLRESR